MVNPKHELLRVSNLTKYFGTVAALVDINFSLEAGEILGVVGQRGSGKSTLFQLLSGVYQPTLGEIIYQGRRISNASCADIQDMGIQTVYQEPYLAENMTVLDNMFLGRELRRSFPLHFLPDEIGMYQTARQLFGYFNAPEELINSYPANLSNENKQLVSLARAMCTTSSLILLDNPLTGLTFERQKKLLTRIKDLAAQNVAVIISSDDLKHLFSITNRILVLYQGTQVAMRTTSHTTAREIVELIVGTNRQDQITPVIWAFESYYTAQQQAEELRRSQQVLKQNLEAQDSLNRQLVIRLRNQVEALDRLNLALQEANRRLMTEREAERKALARDLHDQVMQDLLSYNYQLEEVEGDTGTEEQKEELAKIRNGIRSVVGSLRQMCSDLRPPTIDSHGLSAAISSLAHQWSEQNGIPVDLDIDPALGRLPETIELSVFRIIQEGLSNIRKHARATSARLSLHRAPEASLVVQIMDNGHGIERPIDLASLTQEKHFGLVGISERVSLLGGTMQVNPSAQGGLELQIVIPSPYPSLSA